MCQIQAKARVVPCKGYCLLRMCSFVCPQETDHAFTLVWQKLDFWCYHCMRFVGTKTPTETQHRNDLRLIVGSIHYDKHEKLLVEAKQQQQQQKQSK